MYCPYCGAETKPGHAYCRVCGKSLAEVVEEQPPSPSVPEVAEPATTAVTTPSAASPSKRRPVWLLPGVLAGVVIVLAGAGVGTYLGLRGSDSTEDGEVIRFMSDVPPAEEYLADPSEAIYDEEAGFSEDAVKVLTQVCLQLSLEQYLLDLGAYPSSLDALFPDYAPVDQYGELLTAPPEGYTYVQTGGGDGYDLSVTLSAGKPYTVHQPETTIHYPEYSGEGE